MLKHEPSEVVTHRNQILRVAQNLTARLFAGYEEGADFAEGAELGGVAEPSAGICVGRGSGIWDQFVDDAGEAGGAEQVGPFGGGMEMRWNREIFGPLMAVGIVAEIVDEDGDAAAFGEDAENFGEAARGIGPVVGGFDGDGVGEKIGVPGNFVGTGDYEQNIFDVGEILAGAADHFVGNVEADDASIENAFGEQAREPAGAAANVKDIFVGADVHAVEHGEGDGEMVFLHVLAAAGFGPAVEFFAEEIVGHVCGALQRITPFGRMALAGKQKGWRPPPRRTSSVLRFISQKL